MIINEALLGLFPWRTGFQRREVKGLMVLRLLMGCAHRGSPACSTPALPGARVPEAPASHVVLDVPPTCCNCMWVLNLQQLHILKNSTLPTFL